MDAGNAAGERYRFLVGTVMAAVLAVTLLWLQSLFDHGDVRRAKEAVLAFRPGGESGEALGAALQARTGAPPACSGEVRSSCAGVVRVRCAGPAGAVYELDVALVAKSINPANPAALELFRALGGKP